MKKLAFIVACFVSLSGAYATNRVAVPASPVGLVSAADSVNLTDFVGKYKMENLPFQYITVSMKDGKLMLSTGDQDGELTPLKEADKFDANGQATFQFTRNADKKVTGVTLEAQGAQFEGKKES